MHFQGQIKINEPIGCVILGTFLHWILDLTDDLNTRSLRMEANGVTPIPPPTRTETSKSIHSWWPSPNGPSKYNLGWNKRINISIIKRPRIKTHRKVEPCLWIGSKLKQAFFSVEFTELTGPGPNRSDVQAQGLLVGCWRQCEWVVLICAQHQARYANPLAWTVNKALWSLELQMCHTYRSENQKKHEVKGRQQKNAISITKQKTDRENVFI